MIKKELRKIELTSINNHSPSNNQCNHGTDSSPTMNVSTLNVERLSISSLLSSVSCILKRIIPFESKKTTNTIFLTDECPLKCSFCNLWKHSFLEDTEDEIKQQTVIINKNLTIAKFHNHYYYQEKKPTLFNLITDDSLFKLFKPTEIINIIGGEPFLYHHLEQFLEYLKNKKIIIKLYTTGLVLPNNYHKLLSFIDELYFYLPSIESEEYLTITGFDYLDQVLHNLKKIRETNIKVTINTPLIQENIQNSPDIYNFCEENNLPLLFTYAKNNDFTKETLEYVKRYQRIKNVQVKQVDYLKYNCCGV